MEELYRLIQMSVSASILIGVILLLRAHGQTFFSTRFFKLLWLMVLVRLLVPVNIPMPVSVQTLVQQRHELPVEEQQIIKMKADEQLNHVENSKLEKPAHNIQWLLTLLWFNGMIVVLFCFIITGIRQLNYLQEAIPIENSSLLSEWFDRHPLRRRIQILSHDRVSTPLTYGVIVPKIILPKHMTTQNDETLQMILNHEYIHICQGDYLWKLLMMLAIAFHWFNPMVWLMWRYFNLDIEIACDRNVTELMNREERIAYAQTLINIAEIQSKASWCSSYFGERPIKERIRLLMKRRKQTKFGIVCSAMIFMLSMTVFAGSGKAAEKNPISSAQELSTCAEYQEYEAYGVNLGEYVL